MRIHVLAFARLRELIEAPERSLELPQGARVGDCWSALAQRYPAIAALHGSTRIARNGRLASPNDPLVEGDELALLPPVGGG